MRGIAVRARLASEERLCAGAVLHGLRDRQEARAALLQLGGGTAGERAERIQRSQPRLGYLERAIANAITSIARKAAAAIAATRVSPAWRGRVRLSISRIA